MTRDEALAMMRKACQEVGFWIVPVKRTSQHESYASVCLVFAEAVTARERERAERMTAALLDLRAGYLKVQGCYPLPGGPAHALMTRVDAALDAYDAGRCMAHYTEFNL